MSSERIGFNPGNPPAPGPQASLRPEGPTQSGPTPAVPPSTRPVDARLALFGEYLAAVDRNDFKATIAASRQLRQHGISVVPTSKRGDR